MSEYKGLLKDSNGNTLHLDLFSSIQSEQISGTTDNYSNLKITGTKPKNLVLLVENGQYVFIPFYYSGNWYAKVITTNLNWTTVPTTNITCNVYYV